MLLKNTVASRNQQAAFSVVENGLGSNPLTSDEKYVAEFARFGALGTNTHLKMVGGTNVGGRRKAWLFFSRFSFTLQGW